MATSQSLLPRLLDIDKIRRACQCAVIVCPRSAALSSWCSTATPISILREIYGPIWRYTRCGFRRNTGSADLVSHVYGRGLPHTERTVFLARPSEKTDYTIHQLKATIRESSDISLLIVSSMFAAR